MTNREQCTVCGEFVTVYVGLRDGTVECVDCLRKGVRLLAVDTSENTLYHSSLRKDWGPIVKPSLQFRKMKPVSLHLVERSLRGLADVEDLMED